ncbi:Tubulin--tyrosine ligase-like protein 5 [Plasmodiophora brassicae]|uniref:Tubulin--tyrosine ligase-like protein 9 n=1 Tax=Plasmodiophora brassicae TaxID=37360 RepID=A0A0G4J5H1_PLABS|nr:hypothetical protein PBRA_002777 [Plasmodiophora brassicae]
MTYRIERSSSSGAQPPDLRIVHALFQQQGFAQTSDPSSWHCLWLAPSVRLRLKQYRQLVPGQRVNRFPGGHLLASRWQWVPTSTRLAQVHGDKYALLPAMFRHPEQADAIHLYRQQHLDQYMTVELVDDNGDVVEGTASTIVQPGQPLPRLKRTQRAVITRYIDKHKLVLGRRMVEIVAMASVTSFDPLRVWLYNEAVVYLRAPVHIPASGVDYGFASADQKPRVWGLDDDTDVDPVPDASGRVHRSWTWLQGVLREAGHDHGAVWRRIRESVLQAVTGIQPDVKRLMRLCVHDRQTCYEMFQFNFVLDDRARPWLVRVSAPDLRCISPIQLAVYSGAVADSLNMIRMRPGQPVVPRTKWVTPPSRPKRISAALRRRRRSPSPIKRHANMATPSDMFDAQVETLSPEERDPMLQEMRDAILKEIDEENDRRGRFERLFPCTDASKYADMLSDLDGTLQQVVLTQLGSSNLYDSSVDSQDSDTETGRKTEGQGAAQNEDAGRNRVRGG